MSADIVPTMESPQNDKSDTHADAAHVPDSNQHLASLVNQEEHEQTTIEAIKKSPRTFFWCVYAAWVLIIASFESLAGGAILGIPQFRKDFGHEYKGDYVLEGSWQSAIDGAPRAAIAIGTLIAAWLADKVGRKYMLLIGYVVSYIGITLEVVATSIELVMVGKLINGLAIGTYSSVAVTYVGEIAPLALRGVMTAFCAFGFAFGPLIGAIIQNYTSDTPTRWAYRALFTSQYGFLGVATILWPFMPESPWWLVCNNKSKAAEKSLKWLGFSQEEIPRRMANMQITLAEVQAETEGATYLECFRVSNLRRTLISIGPISLQAFTGITFIGSYFTFYIQLAGYTPAMSFKLQIAQQALSMFGNMISWFLIDRTGRRSLTFWGLIVLLVLLCLTGGLATRSDVGSIKGVIALELIFVWWYNITIGATAYAFLAEASTARLRAKTVAIGVFVQNTLYTILAFVLPYIFNPDKANLGAKTAFIFGGLCVLAIVWVYFYQPETSDRTYEELDEMFLKHVPARKFKGYITESESKGQEAAQQEQKKVDE